MSKLQTKTNREGRRVRQRRIRSKVRGVSDRPRLTVFRSNRYLFAQVIDDQAGRTIIGLRQKSGAARELGLALAKAAQAKKVTKVVFDRSGYRYAGRVRILAEAAREGGLIF